jgi:hypothetical protein
MIRFLIDACVPAKVADAVARWNAANPSEAIDAVSSGDPGIPPRHTPDPDVLVWAELNNRIVVTVDYNTMPSHLADHLAAGRHSPGVFCVRPGAYIPDIIADLVMSTYAGNPDDFADVVTFVPI